MSYFRFFLLHFFCQSVFRLNRPSLICSLHYSLTWSVDHISFLQVLGENPAEVIQTVPASDLLDLFFKHAFAKGTSDNTHSWIWMAITKLLHSLALSPELVHCFLTSLPLMSMSSETQQVSSFLGSLAMIKQPDLSNFIKIIDSVITV